MTVDEVIADLCAKWPKQAEQIRAWKPQYQQVLQQSQGPKLAEAYMVFMTGWTRRDVPNPVDIAKAVKTKWGGTQPKSVSADTAAMNHRADAANAWWKDNNHNPALFREYRHRCRHGIPTVDDLEEIAQSVESDKIFAERGQEGAKMAAREAVKPHYIPMPRKKPEAPADPLKADTEHIEEKTEPSENTGQLDPTPQPPGEPAEIPFD